MRVKSVQLKNFRNYPSLRLQIENGTVVVAGPNAVGKTNLLESIFFASLFKSFREDTEYIFLKGADSAEIKLVLEKKGQEHLLEIFLSKKEKIYANFFIDGVRTKRRKALGFLQVVIFDPTNVDLFSQPPESRRKFLNMAVSQKDPAFLETLSGYKKTLYQKSKLLSDLKNNRVNSAESLDEWNGQIAEQGSRITHKRRELINYLNRNIAEVYTTISGFHRPVEVFYEGADGENLEEIKVNILTKLEKLKERELLSGFCLAGPHKDDFSLKSEGVYLSPFSSRGELRSQVLALKILELEYLSQNGDKPVLLLDDVLSELDETRRKFLLKYLQGKFQAFITTTQPLEMPAQHITLTPAVQEEQVVS